MASLHRKRLGWETDFCRWKIRILFSYCPRIAPTGKMPGGGNTTKSCSK